jgi:hypothetical protein
MERAARAAATLFAIQHDLLAGYIAYTGSSGASYSPLGVSF